MKTRCHYYKSKIAFEIPKAFEIQTVTGNALPDKLIDSLLDLNPDCQIEHEGVCTPYLLIVDCDGMPTGHWIRGQQQRINKVLASYRKKYGMP